MKEEILTMINKLNDKNIALAYFFIKRLLGKQ